MTQELPVFQTLLLETDGALEPAHRTLQWTQPGSGLMRRDLRQERACGDWCSQKTRAALPDWRRQ